jgi:hypothetical protein
MVDINKIHIVLLSRDGKLSTSQRPCYLIEGFIRFGTNLVSRDASDRMRNYHQMQ